jgi:uncharacterized protein (TIGR02466 family)
MENKQGMIIESWFPTLIGFVDNANHNKIENKLTNLCKKIKKEKTSGGKNWVSVDTYNTQGTCNLINIKEFKKLNDWIFEQVKNYSNRLGYKNNFICDDAWFNIYNKNDFQEYHIHPKHSLSAIYFLTSPKEGAARTFFESPISEEFQDPLSDDPLVSKRVNYYPKAGRLIIFRSNVRHCVERHKSNKLRISLAYNFKII